jgi:hypothetical protein
MFHHAHFPFVVIFLLFVVALVIFGGFQSKERPPQ